MSSPSTRPPAPDEPDSRPEGFTYSAGVTRAELIHRGLAAGLVLGAAGVLPEGALAATKRPKAPDLPPGFTDTFTSRFIEANGVRQHAVIGGDGPPLVLVHGWPQNWYQFRLLMPALARDFQVIAVDQRGMGLSDKPRTGYDPATLANDVVDLMDALGHQRFAVVGFDTGMEIGYALAVDHPDRIDRLVVGEAVIPGVSPSPPLLAVPDPLVGRVFHLLFNRLAHLNEELVTGREAAFFGFIFDVEAGTKKLPDDAVRYYVDGFASSREALRGSFELYRAAAVASAQNAQRAKQRLTLPVLAIGGALSLGEAVAGTMNLVADHVRSVVIPDSGHWLAEETPQETLAALTDFLAPYRRGAARARAQVTR
jgi:pimeloyl-ACP methyl ester carboxylesterase